MGLGEDRLGEGDARRRDRRVVDAGAGVGRPDEQDELRLAGAELGLEELAGAGGLGGGVVEAARLQGAEHARADGAGGEDEQDGHGQHQAAPANRETTEAGEHVGLP